MARRFPARAATFQLLIPGRQPCSVGVILVDLDTGTLYWRLVSKWRRFVDDEDTAAWLEAFDTYIRQQVRLLGGRPVFEQLLETLSNILVLADDRELRVSDFQAELDRLYDAVMNSCV